MASTGSSIYEHYIAEQIAREDERKKSIEARGLAVITTSGALATLLLALVTLVRRGDNASTPTDESALPASAHDWIRWALILFAAAGVSALVTNIPFPFYKEARVEGLEHLVDNSWDDSPKEAEATVASNRLAILRSARFWNGARGWMLLLAMAAEVLAVAFIAYAVWLVLDVL
jgi:hypothetical protein